MNGWGGETQFGWMGNVELLQDVVELATFPAPGCPKPGGSMGTETSFDTQGAGGAEGPVQGVGKETRSWASRLRTFRVSTDHWASHAVRAPAVPQSRSTPLLCL